jgi:hypothetical protein
MIRVKSAEREDVHGLHWQGGGEGTTRFGARRV